MLKLIAVLDKLFYYIDKVVQSYKDKSRQKEQDELENSPADWFEHHFDGVQSKDDKAS